MAASAAFFDLDRTLMAGASAFHFGRAAHREGMLPLSRLAVDAAQALWFKLFGASDERAEALRDRILESVRDQPADAVASLSPQVVEAVLPRVRPEARALLEMHEQAGRDVWIVSATPIEIVRDLASALGLTGGIGTEAEVADGRYTGRLIGPFCYGEGKATLVSELAAERGYDLERCYAYADSLSDLPILQLVGHPVAVNPEGALESVARRRGWPVVVFNQQVKDVSRRAALGGAGLAIGTAAFLAGRRHGRRTAPRAALRRVPALLRAGR